MIFEDNRFPQELHDFLHRMGIYSTAGINGAEMAFAWTVRYLSTIPFNEMSDRLCEWYGKINNNKAIKDD